MKKLTLILIFVILINEGNLHHCWECSGKECESDKLDEKYQRICPSLTEKQEKLGLRPVCVKYRAENGTTRSCHNPEPNNSDFCADLRKKNPDFDCNVCGEDFCNSSQNIKPLSVLALVTVSIYVVYNCSFC